MAVSVSTPCDFHGNQGTTIQPRDDMIFFFSPKYMNVSMG